MKYRIKIITYKSGRKVYYAQVKRGFFWRYIWYDGEECFSTAAAQETRESSLKRIDKHFGGNTSKQTIEFEYITK